jgi:hypothetical protein
MIRHKYLALSLLPALPFSGFFVYNFIYLHRGWHSDSHQVTLAMWFTFCVVAPALVWVGPRIRERSNALNSVLLHTATFVTYFALHVIIACALCSFLPLDDDRPWNLFQTIRKQSFEPGLLMFTTTLLGGHWLATRTAEKRTGLLTIKSGRKSHVVDWVNVQSVVAHGQYVKIFTGEKFQVLAASLKSIEAQMPAGFVRVHRSYIVNTASIRETRSLLNGDYELSLSNGQVVRCSRTYREALRSAIGSF